MAIRIESLAEPIPGYRLIERLGGGGFGEVWKCEAPGGLFKAIKFVYGDLESADEEGARAEQELKALSRVKSVRHAYILSLERFDIIEGRLIIVSELADRTLWDRFRECRSQGLPGIPRAELIGYLLETAEALDLMNSLYQLQHLDIKPQNLFLVHNHIKVADFGLVKDLEGMMASVTGGVTPVYAAPETFDGKVTRFSDQYSLAIVYQELLSGKRPFTGTNLRQLLVQHLQQQPDLSALPASDRPVVGRALAKSPDARFPACQDFVRALIEADPVIPGASPAGGSLPFIEGIAPPRGADAGRPRSNPQLPPFEAPALDSQAPTPFAARQASSLAGAPTPGTAPTPLCRPQGVGPPEPLAPRIDTPSPAHQDTPREARPEIVPDDDGVLQPSLVLGLGRLGLGVLRQLRHHIAEQLGDPEALAHLRLLYLDTDPEIAQPATRGRADVALRPSEIVIARLQRASSYLKLNGQGIVAGWLNPRILHRMPRQQTPAGVRALGRLAFVDNYRALARRLEYELAECCRPEPLLHAARETRLGVRSAVPRVYLVTGLSGGSGSGMLLDVAYTVRRLLRQLGHERAEMVGVLLLPQAVDGPGRTAELANSFAALTELRHFSAPDAVFTARYDTEGNGFTQPYSEQGPPFQRCALFALPDPRGSGTPDGDGPPPLSPATERLLARAGHLLYTELATLLGLTADEIRHESFKQAQRAAGFNPAAHGRQRGGMRFHAAGMYRVLWPRRQMLDQAARGVCRRLVERWMSKDGRPVREPLQAWVKERWEHLGLAQIHLIARFQRSCAHDLQQAPEDLFAAIAASVLPPPGPRPIDAEVTVRPAAVCEALTRLEQLLGVPEECRLGDGPDSPSQEPGQLERALADTASTMRDEYEQKLAEVAVRLIEDPHYRLAGAEEALRQLSAQVEEALQLHEDLARELQQRAVAAYQRLQDLLSSPTALLHSTPSRRAGFLRRTPTQPGPAVEVLELLRNYPKWRYQSLVLERVNALYLSLRGQLSDQLREVDYCRARLTELLGLLTPTEANGQRGAPVAGRCLLPSGCRSLDEAVRRLDKAVGPEQLVALDRRVQLVIRKQCRALVRVCLASATVLRGLLPLLLQEARTFLEPHLDASDVTKLYLEQHEAAEGQDCLTSDTLRQDLRALFEKAAPAPCLSQARETVLLGVPAGAAGQEFCALAREALAIPNAEKVATDDEIILYREQNHLTLADLEQLGPVGQEAYRKVFTQEYLTPHSRTDITDW